MNKIRSFIPFVFLIILFSCSPSDDASKKVERRTGDEMTLKCGTWGTFSVKVATNECNSMQCVSWNDKSITIKQQTFAGSTVILRKDLTFWGYGMVGGDKLEGKGVCEIVDTSDNIL